MRATFPSSRRVCSHEANHCSSLIMSGLMPLWVRVDWPTDRLRGSVGLDWDSWPATPHTLRLLLIAALQGPASDGSLNDDWPIEPTNWDDGSRQDAEQAALIASHLAFDRVDWHSAIYQADGLRRDFHYRTLAVTLTHELERVEVLLQPELIELSKTVIGERDET